MLIDQCLCGSTEYRLYRRTTSTALLELARCDCGTEWLNTNDTIVGLRDYYASGAYHNDEHRHGELVNYRDRYDGDRRAAQKRAIRYFEKVGERWWQAHEPVSILDVGAANGAFVDEMIAQGHRALGVEPDPAFARPPTIIRGDIWDAPRAEFDLVTYHDVLEHVPSPREELAYAVGALRPGGVVVVDVPDVHVDPGRKHYKQEHLWYFTLRSLVDVVRSVGLEVLTVDFPLPGKMVVYGCRARSE